MPINHNQTHNISNPTPLKIVNELRANAKMAFTNYEGVPLWPSIGFVQVNHLFENLFPNPQIDWENYGIRIYPALIEDKEVIRLAFVYCRSTNYNPGLEKESPYYLLDPGNPVIELQHIKIEMEIANGLVLKFLSKVKIKGEVQTKDNPYYKTSRYFEWITLRSYFLANGYSPDNPNADDFELAFEFGWTELKQALELFELYYNQVAESARDLLGYTAILTLYFRKESLASNDTNRPASFKQGVIEIGNPCPPRCKGEGLF